MWSRGEGAEVGSEVGMSAFEGDGDCFQGGSYKL